MSRCLGPYHCLLLLSLKGPPHPDPVHRGEIEAGAVQLGLGRSVSPSLGLESRSICVVLGIPSPDKDRLRALLSWERTLWKAPDPFLSQILGPRIGRGKAQGKEGWLGDRTSLSGWP